MNAFLYNLCRNSVNLAALIPIGQDTERSDFTTGMVAFFEPLGERL
jgi:hypothetical protein